MARINQQKIQEILNHVNIVDVVSNYIPLTRAGKNYKGICPFHDDSNPSLSVSEELQIYKCFVCNAGGNAITFVEKYLHIDYYEAVEIVANMAGVDLGGYDLQKRVPQVNEEYKDLYDMHEQAQKIYSHLLHTSSGLKAYEYLQSRHIDDKIIEKFQIGYAASDTYLVKAFEKLGYSNQAMALSGLVLESDYGYFDRYKNRVMFPLHDPFGKVVGFSGRIYQGEKDVAKYMNSPESSIFIKSKILYNYHRSASAIKKEGFVYLLEGFMDVIALSRIGIDNTLALMGTALTKEHMQLIKKVTNKVYICLDGDKAGHNAALKASRALLEENFQVMMISLIEGYDPDEILEEFGEQNLKIALNTLQTPIDFELDDLIKNTNLQNYEDKKEFIMKACKLVVTCDDPMDYHHYLERISQVSSFEISYLEEYMRSLRHKTSVRIKDPVITMPKTRHFNKYEKAERSLLFYMLHDKKATQIYERDLGIMYLGRNRIIASYIMDYYRTFDTIELKNFTAYVNNSDMIEYILDVYDEKLPLEYDEVVLKDYISTILQYARLLEIQELKKAMEFELDALEKAKLAKAILELQKNKEG